MVKSERRRRRERRAKTKTGARSQKIRPCSGSNKIQKLVPASTNKFLQALAQTNNFFRVPARAPLENGRF